MGKRRSPIEVAKEEFNFSIEEPYFWTRLQEPNHISTVVDKLDSDSVRFEPKEFPGLVFQPQFSETAFVFLLNGGILVDLISVSKEDAQTRIEELLSTFVARGILDDQGHDEIMAASHDNLSTEKSDSMDEASGLSLNIDLQEIFHSMVARPLFDPRDILDFPNSDLTLLYDELEGSDSIKYDYGDEVGHCDLISSPSRKTFAGFDSENNRGFVFTRERLCYPFEFDGRYKDGAVADSGATIFGINSDATTVRVIDETGKSRFETNIEFLNNVTISPEDQYWGYAGIENQQEVILCELSDGEEAIQTRVPRFGFVEYDADQGGFCVAESLGDEFSKLLAPDGTVIDSFDLETSRGSVDELLLQLDEESNTEILTDLRKVAKEKPDLLAQHVPSLLSRIQEDRFPGPEYHLPPLFRSLAKEASEAFKPVIDDVYSLLERPESTIQSEIAIKVFQELLRNDVSQDQIIEKLCVLIEDGTEDQRILAFKALSGLQPVDLVEYEQVLDLSLETLGSGMPPKLMNPVTSVLKVHEKQDGREKIVNSIVSADKTDSLVYLLRYGNKRRGDTVNPGLSLDVSVTKDDSSDKPDNSGTQGGELSERELYYLNKNVATLLKTVAKIRPKVLVPHLGLFLLDVKTEDNSLKIVRRNAIEIVEQIVENGPPGLEQAAQRNEDLIIELLEHEEPRAATLGIQLGEISGSELVHQKIKQIVDNPSHHAWTEAKDAVNRLATGPDSTVGPKSTEEDFDESKDSLTRLRKLSVDPNSDLAIPSPSDIENLRKKANKKRSDIERRGKKRQRIHRSYIHALENGDVSPPLSVLAEIVFSLSPNDEVIERFPTGPRIQARREEMGFPLDELAEIVSIPQERLHEIETNRADPQAHELESILAAISGTDSEKNYPNRQPVRTMWIEFGTELAKELGRFPKSGELVPYPDIEGNPELDKEDTGFDGPETVDVKAEMPRVPHWSVFYGWSELLAELDVNNTYRTSGAPLRSTLIEELQRINTSTEGLPTTTEIDELSDYSYHYYKKEFGGIQDAYNAANIR